LSTLPAHFKLTNVFPVGTLLADYRIKKLTKRTEDAKTANMPTLVHFTYKTKGLWCSWCYHKTLGRSMLGRIGASGTVNVLHHDVIGEVISQLPCKKAQIMDTRFASFSLTQ
jgi:hypothetical protein